MTDDEIRESLTFEEKLFIKSYADNNMRLCPAARVSYCNYQTLDFRLSQIYKRTKLNPRNFYDLVKLMKIIGNEVAA